MMNRYVIPYRDMLKTSCCGIFHCAIEHAQEMPRLRTTMPASGFALDTTMWEEG